MDEISCELISLSDRLRWTSALQRLPHAFGHTWECCSAMQLSSGLPTYLFLFHGPNGNRVVCPLSERTYNGHKEVVTPYGFSGFIGSAPLPEFPAHWAQFVHDRGYTCGYIGLNPVLDNLSQFFQDDLFGYNTLFVFNLSRDVSQILSDFPGNRRRQVANFEKSGVSYSTDKVLLKEFFLEHFYSFFMGKEAPLLYNFRVETLTMLLDAEALLLVGAVRGGRVEAVSVFAHTPYTADYLFNVSLPEGRHHTTPLIWYAVQHYKGIHVPFLNLGGGVSEGDSIAAFKERFRADRYRLQCLKQVYDLPVYERLCREKGVDPADRTAYFPAYRSKQ